MQKLCFVMSAVIFFSCLFFSHTVGAGTVINPPTIGGSTSWPITSKFCLRKGTPHKGIDIAGGSAVMGAVISQPAGTSLECRTNGGGIKSGYGYYALFKHGDVTELHGHLQQSCSGSGKVLLDHTGRSTGAHDHYEIILSSGFSQSNKVDPEAAWGLDLSDPEIRQCLLEDAAEKLRGNNCGQAMSCGGAGYTPTGGCTYDDYLAALFMRESSGDASVVNQYGYMGLYQMGTSALTDVCGTLWSGCQAVCGFSSQHEFLHGTATQTAEELQRCAIDEYNKKQVQYIGQSYFDKYVGECICGIEITHSGILAGAHLKGHGGVKGFLDSQDCDKYKDANGTNITEYIWKFAGYDMTGEPLHLGGANPPTCGTNKCGDDPPANPTSPGTTGGYGQGVPANSGTVPCACVPPAHDSTQKHGDEEIKEHERLLVSDLFYGNIVPAMMMMTEQLSAMAYKQVEIIGAFFDAKERHEAHQGFLKAQAEIHKTYRPSVGMCEIGSAMKSMYATQVRQDWTKLMITKYTGNRQMLTVGTAAEEGNLTEIPARLKQYRERYCDRGDFNKAVDKLCQNVQTTKKEVWNKDIDWARTISEHHTIPTKFDVVRDGDDYTNFKDTETDIYALASNMYGNRLMASIPWKLVKSKYDNGSGEIENNPVFDLYMGWRSLAAMRNVAVNSFAHNVALRSEGMREAIEYQEALLKELGVNLEDDELRKSLLGDNPSYLRQMEILTNIMTYNPDFYVNLYENTENVQRKRVALQAIGLIQKWEILESLWRSEMNASVAAEIRLREKQTDVQDRVNSMTINN